MTATEASGAQAAPTVFSPITPSPALREDEPYGRDELLHEIFDRTCRQCGWHGAVRLLGDDPESSRRTALSYVELRDRALRFARQLRDMGVQRGDRVVLCLPRGLDQYMAILGVLWAGGCYVPVDWTYPRDRIDFIVEDSGAVVAGRGAQFLIGTARASIGVDLELLVDDPLPSDQVSDLERIRLAGASHRDWTLCWAAKEAHCKRLGVASTTDPASVTALPAAAGTWTVHTGSAESVCHFRQAGDAVLAVAVGINTA